MMRFREFVLSDVVVLADFIADAMQYAEAAVGFKGNVTRNKEAVISALDIHLKKQAAGGTVTAQLIVDTIRHQFTNYDAHWQYLGTSRNNSRIDLCEYIKQWNETVTTAKDRVDFFIQKYLPPSQHGMLQQANANWLRNKLKPVPPECKDDDDPRKWRTGFRRP
jgi:hypothetical protein